MITPSKRKSLSDLVNFRETQENINSKRVLSVNADEVISKEQVRQEFINIDELAESIVSDGQQSPIIVYPKNEEGLYVIQKGERRWRAIQFAGIEKIDIIVNTKPLTKADEVAGELIENIQRDDLKPLEIANGIQQLLEQGLNQNEICKRIGKGKNYVSLHVQLIKADSRIRTVAMQGLTRDIVVLNALKQLSERDPEKFEVYIEGVLSGSTDLSRNEVENLMKENTSTSSTNISDNVLSEQPEPSGDALGESNQEGLHSNDNFDDSDERDDDEFQASEVIQEKSDSSQDDPLKKARDWSTVDPREVIVRCTYITDEANLPAVLRLDRVCSNPSEVWIKVTDGNTTKSIQVNVDSIELTGAE